MAEPENEQPILSEEELQSYREELLAEIRELEKAQKEWPSRYKAQRINILKRRLE